jgi:hypothetical protein
LIAKRSVEQRDRLMEEWIQKTKKDLQIFAGLLIINSVECGLKLSTFFEDHEAILNAKSLLK